MPMPKTRAALKILGLIIIVLLAWVAWISLQPPFQPPHERPNVSVKFLGYKNDAAGARLAMIKVTNLSASTIYVYRPLVEIPDKTEPAGLAFDQSHRQLSWHSKLGRDMSGNFTILLPTNQPSWRLTVLVDYDYHQGIAQDIQNLMIGRTARRMPYDIESDWIQN
jgi:hypothetical protein